MSLLFIVRMATHTKTSNVNSRLTSDLSERVSPAVRITSACNVQYRECSSLRVLDFVRLHGRHYSQSQSQSQHRMMYKSHEYSDTVNVTVNETF